MNRVDAARRCRLRSGVALALVLLLLAPWLASCGDERATRSELWRFAIEEKSGSVQDAYAQEFKRRIEERTGGAVRVKVFPYGSLGTSDDLTEQLRMGSLQFAMASPGHLGKTIPEVQVFLLHFVLSDDDEANRVALGSPAVRAELAPRYRAQGLELLSIFPEGWMVWTTDAPVRRPADFEGVKIRTMTSPLLLRTYAAYGASPQSMPYAEVYSALQLNMIDAQVNPVFAIEEMSFFEVTEVMTFAKPAQFVTTAVANPTFFDGLTEERRSLVREVVAGLDRHVFEVQERYNAERLEAILARKPELRTVVLSEAERDLFRQRSLPVREAFLEQAGEGARRLLEALLTAVARAEARSPGGDGTREPAAPGGPRSE